MPKHPGGRPTKYRPEYVEQVIADSADGYSLTAFAGKIGVGRDTISEWAAVHPEFSAAVKQCKALRARWWEDRARHVAQSGGPGGQATMVIFGLKNHAPEDYRERTELQHSGPAGGPIEVSIEDRRAAALRAVQDAMSAHAVPADGEREPGGP